MRLHKHKVLSYFQWIGAVLAFSLGSSQASQVLTLSENKRLEIIISADSMNRIAITNDRIAQVFGDEGTFVSQADEHTGQLFIKPSSENGTKPLSITVITENGVTQDLILKPTATRATTTVFNTSVLNSRVFNTSVVKNTARQGVFKDTINSSIESLQTTLPFQEQLLLIMRQLVGGQLVEKEETENYNRPTPEGYKLEYSKSYQADLFSAQVFSIQNTTSTAIELLEKTFYCVGDFALSFEKRILLPGEKTQLFVVRSL
ncbi:MAG: type-F conjugative transfer system secretin TraK [Alphaproteobacteria bacterium]|nr:type-F conjugative transfer system secretin TraK [Alphaproteobacteria bacterium]